MQRRAFQLRIREGQTEAYDAAHREVWPELLAELHSFGVQDYSIFRRDRELFLYLRVADWDDLLRKLDGSALNAEWQRKMAPLLEPAPSIRSGETFAVMNEVFFFSGGEEFSGPSKHVVSAR